jgi:hypothetical protein
MSLKHAWNVSGYADGSAHAQFHFQTDHGERVMRKTRRVLSVR